VDASSETVDDWRTLAVAHVGCVGIPLRQLEFGCMTDEMTDEKGN